jgi:hypothetical protein
MIKRKGEFILCLDMDTLEKDEKKETHLLEDFMAITEQEDLEGGFFIWGKFRTC